MSNTSKYFLNICYFLDKPKKISSANVSGNLEKIEIKFNLSAPYVDGYNVSFYRDSFLNISNTQFIDAAPTMTSIFNKSLIVPGAKYIIEVTTVVRDVGSEAAIFSIEVGE